MSTNARVQCAQCGKPTNPETDAYFFGRDFCDDSCLAEFKRPEVGKPATYSIGSDRYPYTVVSVSPSGAKIGLRRDECRRGVYLPAEGREVEYAYRTKDGGYRLGGGGYVSIGVRDDYRDPSF